MARIQDLNEDILLYLFHASALKRLPDFPILTVASKTDRNSALRNITHVCSRWRAAATGDPSLWTYVVKLIPANRPARWELFDLQIVRAKPRAVAVDVVWPPRVVAFHETVEDQIANIRNELYRIIDQGDHIGELRLGNMPAPPMTIFFTQPFGSMARLTSVFIHSDADLLLHSALGRISATDGLLSRSTRLSEVCLVRSAIILNIPPIVASRLERCMDTGTTAECLELLESASNLQRLVYCTYASFPQAPQAGVLPHAVHERLKSLILSSQRLLEDLLQAITLPSLETLHVQPYLSEVLGWSNLNFAQFLQRSQFRLLELSLTAVATQDVQIVECLQMLPELLKLVISDVEEHSSSRQLF